MEGGITIAKSTVSFAGICVDQLVKKYGTPLYVFGEKRLIDNYHALLKSFRRYYSQTEIFYSIKTNSELKLLQSLRSAGSCAEAASALEVQLAIKAGFNPSDIILDGPAWTDEDISFCLNKNIKIFNVDSLDLLFRLNQLAKKMRKKVDISFRIYPEIKMSILKSFIEGYIAKFGVPLSQSASCV